MGSGQIVCDGCGQLAGPEHISRRLKRLEQMTRYRPIHVQMLFLAAVSPAADGDYLYGAVEQFQGEGLELLNALDLETQGRSVEAALAEFQRHGYVLSYILECPMEFSDASKLRDAVEKRLNATLTRIRRSFKPKRVVLLGHELDAFVQRFKQADLGGELVASKSGLGLEMHELENTCRVTGVTATSTGSL